MLWILCRYVPHHFTHCLFPLPLWHKLLLSVPKGGSICHSHNVCIPRWILICRLFRCVREASSWPLCLSGLNCLITVIIWTGSRITWHPDTTLALLRDKKKRRRRKKKEKHFEKPSGCCGGLWRMNEDALVCVWSTGVVMYPHHIHEEDRPHAYSAAHPLACIWIPHVSRTFRRYQMKKLHVRASVPSEEGPGAVWLIHDSPGALRPGSPCSAL